MFVVQLQQILGVEFLAVLKSHTCPWASEVTLKDTGKGEQYQGRAKHARVRA